MDILNIFSPVTKQWFKDNLGEPTDVQKTAWQPIADGKDVLVSAPTGTGKTLTAFLVFIDRLKQLAREAMPEKGLYLIYISPLKSLAGDIRENLKRPLEGISDLELSSGSFSGNIKVSIRTGDTPQNERRAMLKTPPQILITTPESLYLLLTSESGLKLLSSAKAIILDELHAMIDSKRGAHLMLSLARLDKLCKKPLQRIGLSATVEPLSRAAEYLSPREVVIAAPKMNKAIEIKIINPYLGGTGETVHDNQTVTLWDDLSRTIYQYCSGKRSVIAFLEGRAYAEKLAFFVNKLGGEGFARTHHGCLAKEQRFEVEQMLRAGELRLLCATSSMELGIDVGDIDEVFQIGCPATVSGTMQRLGRAGHNPGRTSRMFIFPRTSWEGLYCAMTADTALKGALEPIKPPVYCLDILSQHLVSMAVGNDYTVDDIMELLPLAYPFKDVTRSDVCAVLEMLAGDYEHGKDMPVRPRLLYDRIHESVSGDNYSRMLAVSAGGTIPDRGMYTAKTESGAKVGELDEEFVFESRVGERFRLGTFAWEITKIEKDTVTVKQTSANGARVPFWHNEWRGRGLQTGLRFGKIMRGLNTAYEKDKDLMLVELYNLGLDEGSAKSADNFLRRQIASTGILPDDKNIIIEHLMDTESGKHMVMFHSVFGRQVNAPLSVLVHEAAERISGLAIGCVDTDDGFLLYPFGGSPLPKGLLNLINPTTAKQLVETILPALPMFAILFRYNTARSLLTGIRKMGRTPLWLQRLRSAEILNAVIGYKNHPIVRETKRECLNDLWDLDGMEQVLNKIISGEISVRELVHESASPMSLPSRWLAEAAVMYDYSPVTSKVTAETAKEMMKLTGEANGITPDAEQLAKIGERTKLPKNEQELHTLLMIEGDLVSDDLPLPPETLITWLEALAKAERAVYTEPGLWVAAEHAKAYEAAFSDNDDAALQSIIRRLLRYRGAKSAEQIRERYFLTEHQIKEALSLLEIQDAVTENDGLYYHAELYNRAKNAAMIKRRETKTLPPENYAALLAGRTRIFGSREEQLDQALDSLCGIPFPAEMWESVLLPARVDNYNPAMLDAMLSEGKFYWQLQWNENVNALAFFRTEEIDWDKKYDEITDSLLDLSEAEKAVYNALKQRGASFTRSLTGLVSGVSPYEPIMSLVEKGLICADGFLPVRQTLGKDKLVALKHKINAKTALLSNANGRWDLVRPRREKNNGQKLVDLFRQNVIVARETVRGISWGDALETLRVWEYTGQARRGYFIEGLSGAQFIEGEAYAAAITALQNPSSDIIWLPAHDPSQAWGKYLPHFEMGDERRFSNIAGSAVALCKGLPAAIFEKQGKVLRVFDYTCLVDVLEAFKADFAKKRVFPSKSSITIKNYPKDAETALKKVGFSNQMLDYILYNKI